MIQFFKNKWPSDWSKPLVDLQNLENVDHFCHFPHSFFGRINFGDPYIIPSICPVHWDFHILLFLLITMDFWTLKLGLNLSFQPHFHVLSYIYFIIR